MVSRNPVNTTSQRSQRLVFSGSSPDSQFMIAVAEGVAERPVILRTQMYSTIVIRLVTGGYSRLVGTLTRKVKYACRVWISGRL